MRMIDTQILVHMKAGRRAVPIEGAVASVSAKEFLIMYGQQANRDRYYLSLRRHKQSLLGAQINTGSPPGHPIRRQSTDRLSIDFNNEYPSLVEYGSLAVSHCVNNARIDIFAEALGALPKQEQRSLRERFMFLLEKQFRCYALEEESVSIGLDILNEFLANYEAKGNFCNTVRDAMILGTAVKHGAPLQTEDKLLAKLAAKRFGAGLHHDGDDIVVDFGRSPATKRRLPFESKGYINRGWRIAAYRERGRI